ncbi:toxin PIN domain [Candidatus Termititenax aidoneus]|uniref:Toxin PIN domain n=1 Tax=Termititenax aidoneus TaxID=2218524 RepID=A0A388TDY1_TERA1|nr:toxin PIN domain [Candidatus Termititenax aidoneus]
MNILLDTNIILDVLLKRSPFYIEALKIFELAEADKINGFISATAFTDIYYLVRKVVGNKNVQKILRQLTAIFTILAVAEPEILNALDLQWKDFEDAVQYTTALGAQMDGIVSRNKQDYPDSKVPLYEPAEFLQKIIE